MSYITDLTNLFDAMGVDFEKMDSAFRKTFPEKKNGNKDFFHFCAMSNCKREENDKAVIVKLLMPEVDKSELCMSIECTNNGENYVSIGVKGEGFDRTFLKMEKDEKIKIPFDDCIDESKIRAHLENGVLTVVMPKREQKKINKQINIE